MILNRFVQTSRTCEFIHACVRLLKSIYYFRSNMMRQTSSPFRLLVAESQNKALSEATLDCFFHLLPFIHWPSHRLSLFSTLFGSCVRVGWGIWIFRVHNSNEHTFDRASYSGDWVMVKGRVVSYFMWLNSDRFRVATVTLTSQPSPPLSWLIYRWLTHS